MTGFLTMVKDEDKGYKPIIMKSVQNLRVYTATGQVLDYTALMKPAESNTYAITNNYVTTYLEKNTPALIKASGGITAKAWSDYCTGLNKLSPSDVTKIYQDIRDRI
jgi:hypothetical protein